MNKERLETLAVFLDSLPDKLFDFTRWVGEGALPPAKALAKGGGCGTTACAVGWAPAVFPEHWHWFTREANTGELVGLKPEHRGWWRAPGQSSADIFDPVRDAEFFFDLDGGEAAYLFTPHEHTEDEYCTYDDSDECLRPDEHARPKDVAAHIRRFIKAGGEY